MKRLVSVLLVFMFLVLGVTSSTSASSSEVLTCNGSTEEYTEIFGYDRICKLDGIWYGVIDVESRNVFSTTNYGANWFSSNIYTYYLEFAFTRETKQLNKIVINVKHDEYNLNFTGIGGSVPALDETREFIYDDSQIGLEDAKNLTEAFGDGNITTSVAAEYDYVVNLDLTTTRAISVSIDILEFYYVLTDEEVAAVNVDIQSQYLREVNYILSDGSLDETLKQEALDDLNVEYQEYTIEFDEEIHSLCLNNEMCHFEYLSPLDEILTLGSVKSLLKDALLVIIVVGILAYIAVTAGVEGFKIFIKICWSFIETVANIIYQVIMVPIFSGIEWFLQVFFAGLGGRY